MVNEIALVDFTFQLDIFNDFIMKSRRGSLTCWLILPIRKAITDQFNCFCK